MIFNGKRQLKWEKMKIAKSRIKAKSHEKWDKSEEIGRVSKIANRAIERQKRLTIKFTIKAYWKQPINVTYNG